MAVPTKNDFIQKRNSFYKKSEIQEERTRKDLINHKFKNPNTTETTNYINHTNYVLLSYSEQKAF